MKLNNIVTTLLVGHVASSALRAARNSGSASFGDTFRFFLSFGSVPVNAANTTESATAGAGETTGDATTSSTPDESTSTTTTAPTL